MTEFGLKAVIDTQPKIGHGFTGRRTIVSSGWQSHRVFPVRERLTLRQLT